MTPKQKKDATHYIVLNVLVIAALCFIVQDEPMDMGIRTILVVILLSSNAIISVLKSDL